MLNIAFTFDERVADGTAALIASISRASVPSQVQLHGLYPDGQDQIAKSIARYTESLGLQLVLDSFDDEQLLRLPEHPSLPRAAFRRLFQPALLKDRCEQYIYLDTDVFVMDNPAKMLEQASRSKTVNAVPDVGFPSLADGLSFLSNESLSVDLPYVNSGVMVVNISRWLRNNYTERVVEFSESHAHMLRLGDQDAINYVLREDIHILDSRWNVMVGAMDYQRRMLGLPKPSRRQISEAAQRAGILHFAGGGKPWSKKWYVHHRGLYYDLLIKAGWKSRFRACLERVTNKFLGGWDSLSKKCMRPHTHDRSVRL